MLKKLFLLIFFIVYYVPLFSQGIVFEDNITLDAALQKAKLTKKFVFIDCYAPWCVPCKVMSNEIFPQKGVGDFYNAHFINLKINTDAPENKDVAAKYFISSYPTFIYLDSSGEIIHKAMGGMNAGEFIKTGEKAIGSLDNYKTTVDKIKKGDRNPELLEKYFDFIPFTDEKETLTIDYLNKLDDIQKLNDTAWRFFNRYVNKIKSAPCIFFITNINQFIERFGWENVKKKTVNLFIYNPEDDKKQLKLLKKINHKFYNDVERDIKMREKA